MGKRLSSKSVTYARDVPRLGNNNSVALGSIDVGSISASHVAYIIRQQVYTDRWHIQEKTYQEGSSCKRCNTHPG